MNDDALLRYSRHILLPEIGVEGQERILNSRALVIGVGGLGSPAALYLAAAGVGHITLADGDTVDLTNLQRQILHSMDSIGVPKARSGKAALHRFNPDVQVSSLEARAEGAHLSELVQAHDVVLDCTDNFATRHAINRACVQHKRPLISGAAIRFDAQISVYDPRAADSPCYHCVFPEGHSTEELRCAVMGVFAPLTGIIGSMQAAEALKVMSQVGTALTGQLLMLDALTMQWQKIRVRRNPECAVCGGH